jgi:hypothetical protein
MLCAVTLAIVAHAILPSQGGLEHLDSFLVKTFGFPAISVIYFVLLFSFCAVVVMLVCDRTKTSELQAGIRLGSSYALIYLLGMQEVMVESSPFDSYGYEFVKYQFFIGLGDAIPVFLLCVIIAKYTIKKSIKNDFESNLYQLKKLHAFSIISICIFIERILAYKSNVIHNNCDLYMVPCYIWTALFSMALGLIYLFIHPLLIEGRNKINISIKFVIYIGANWIIFNIFMGFIIQDAMIDALLRSGLDVAVLFFASLFASRYKISTRSYMINIY